LNWRIRGRQTFARLLREGTRFRATTLWCTVLLDAHATPPRVAFSISRAVGPATARNRLRRQLRSLVADADLPGGWWLFGVRPSEHELTFDTLRRDVTELVVRSTEALP
jgi:ribonuclease P protein component